MSSSKSTGPKSQTGKEIASMNAFKHGLTAQKWMSPELGRYFDQVLRALNQEYFPKTPTEILMVERVATTMTKIKRLNSIEDAQHQLAKELVKQRLGGIISPNEMKLLRPVPNDVVGNEEKLLLQQEASMPSLEIMNLINRQQNSLSRQLSKELSELITIIERRKNLINKSILGNSSAPNESSIDEK
jgi:hypothetical protein